MFNITAELKLVEAKTQDLMLCIKLAKVARTILFGENERLYEIIENLPKEKKEAGREFIKNCISERIRIESQKIDLLKNKIHKKIVFGEMFDARKIIELCDDYPEEMGDIKERLRIGF